MQILRHPVLTWVLLCFALFFGAAGVLYAQTDMSLHTQIRPVYQNSPQTNVGVIQIRVEADIFANASAEAPLYLRLALSDAAQWADSLTHDDDRNPVAVPIYLPLTLVSNNSDAVLTAAPNAVALVRHKQGEGELWLRISQASSNWVRIGENTEAPSSQHQVQITLGQGAPVARSYLQERFGRGAATLPFPTINETSSATADARSLFLNVSLSQSSLFNGLVSGDNNLVVTPTLYDAGTTGVLSAGRAQDIELGNVVSAEFNPTESIVARQSLNFQGCDVIAHLATSPFITLCEDRQAEDRFLMLESLFDVDFSCPSLNVLKGTRVAVDLRTNPNLFLPVQVDSEGNPLLIEAGQGLPVGAVWCHADSFSGSSDFSPAFAYVQDLQDVKGRLVAKRAYVQYTGEANLDQTTQLFAVRPWSDRYASSEWNLDVAFPVVMQPTTPVQHPEFPNANQAATPVEQPTTEDLGLVNEIWSISACDQVTFPDAALAGHLLALYDTNKNQVLEQSEAQGITFIDLSDPAVTDLRGIERLPNLEVIDIAGQINAVRSLVFMANPEEIDLRDNRITDIRDLRYLPENFGKSEDHVLLLSGNQIANTDTQCDVVRELRERFRLGRLDLGLQRNPAFFENAAGWPALNVLDLVASINQDGPALYELACFDEDRAEVR